MATDMMGRPIDGGGSGAAVVPPAIFAPIPALAVPTGWRVDGTSGALVQDPRTWQDVANAVSSVPSGWSLSDTSSRLASAAISSGALTMTHNAGGSDTYGVGSTSSPYYSRTIGVLLGVTWQRTYRIRLTSFSALDSCARTYVGTSAGSSLLGADIIATSGTTASLRGVTNGTFTNLVTGISAATAAAGYWIRETVDMLTGACMVEYQAASSDTEPTSGWTFGRKVSTSSLADPTVTSWTIAFAVSRASSGTGPVAVFTLGSETVFDAMAGATMPYLGAGYSTSAAEFVLYDDVFVYTATDADILTALEAKLADIVNKMTARSSTWAAKIERSTTAGTYSGGTFNNLGALAVAGAGNYCRVTMRSTAGSTAAGASLDLRRASFLLT